MSLRNTHGTKNFISVTVLKTKYNNTLYVEDHLYLSTLIPEIQEIYKCKPADYKTCYL